ncbi:MAG: hypothetical protein V8T87_03655 [Victivallales bacterium]
MFNSNRLYGASGLTELPVGFSPYESAAGRKYNLKEPFGHGGADSYLWQLFAEVALRYGRERGAHPASGRVAHDLAGRLRGRVPRIRRGGEGHDCHYPWERGDFARGYACFPGAGMTFPCGVPYPCGGQRGLI